MTPPAPAASSPDFIKPDRIYPDMGAVFDGHGTHFAVFSENAQAIELCLFGPGGRDEQRLELPHREGPVFSGYLPGIRPGQQYGYRAHGPYDPAQGHRFNPNKLLLDPYARATAGRITWDDALWGYDLASGDPGSFDTRDSAPFMAKGIVEDPQFDWEGDKAMRRPWSETIIYEAHVRGLTMQHPGVPEALRGTYAGMSCDAILEHLTRLGVTAIELLPCQFFLDDRMLIDKGLSNYWGYQTLGFFAPEVRYLAEGELAPSPIRQFKDMVRRFHRAGIEVIMDVVYNHTAEGSERGPTLSFRGLDNASYYVLSSEDPRYCHDVTGTGNSLSVAHPMVMRMVMDSLRYWVEVMHIDGFRFDLASTLGRQDLSFERGGAFFAAMGQDPVLSGVKLIAEPWDVGEGGYQVGGFPHPFREWNDKFRDGMRGFWRGDSALIGEVANHMLGSPQQFNHTGRAATSSVNFLCAHDGFTLMDTVSFNSRHNEANGEDGADGHDNNLSDNMGAEGPSDDPAIIAARARRRRAMLASLMLAQGVPMLLAGDEIGNSQQGNNNVYCQDNATSWIDWASADEAMLDYVRGLSAFRASHPVLAQNVFLHGDSERVEIAWFQPDGSPMDEAAWGQAELRVLGLYIDRSQRETGEERDGERPLFIVLNAGGPVEFTLPGGPDMPRWHPILESGSDQPFPQDQDAAITTASVPGGSVCVYAGNGVI
jgi:glycogen operon protein